MSRRVKVNDVVSVTGLSRATVDRALNNRGGIHPNTQRLVQDAYQSLSMRGHGDALTAAVTPQADGAAGLDAVIRFGRGLTKQIIAERDLLAPGLKVFDMQELDENKVFEFVSDLCRDVTRPLIIGAKNEERLGDELVRARRRGKRIVTLVSDLSPQARDAHVGIDNRKAGQAAALIVGQGLRNRPAKVAVVLGDPAFRGHEDREIGFRSYLRSAFPSITLSDAAKGDDSAERTYEAVSSLIREHADLDAIYNVGGGNLGLGRALREAGLAEQVVVVTHETNDITLPLVRDGTIDFLIAQSPAQLLTSAIKAACAAEAGGAAEYDIINFTIHTKFNVPAHGRHPYETAGSSQAPGGSGRAPLSSLHHAQE